ncbi:MAG: site-2 protease family protein [Gammaproteobacteria bacterium]|nr:site-2 protease family protein [Gammaproteobacteria bacterium]MCP5136911.1 site-2 protease family protein [Gammaproteobacteria bacterium]
MQDLSTFQLIWVMAIPVVFAITVHEVAHGWVAKQFGDPTADQAGRLTLNPFKHVDPVGTVLIPAVLVLAKTGFLFGWAKPVPVAFNQLDNPKRDMALVAAAGPGINLVMAIGWGVFLKLVFATAAWFGLGGDIKPLIYMAEVGIQINLVLMLLNLLPIPPLDGGRVLAGVLPDRASMLLGRIEPFGLVIMIGLLATGVLAGILGPLVGFAQQFIFALLGL